MSIFLYVVFDKQVNRSYKITLRGRLLTLPDGSDFLVHLDVNYFRRFFHRVGHGELRFLFFPMALIRRGDQFAHFQGRTVYTSGKVNVVANGISRRRHGGGNASHDVAFDAFSGIRYARNDGTRGADQSSLTGQRAIRRVLFYTQQGDPRSGDQSFANFFRAYLNLVTRVSAVTGGLRTVVFEIRVCTNAREISATSNAVGYEVLVLFNRGDVYLSSRSEQGSRLVLAAHQVPAAGSSNFQERVGRQGRVLRHEVSYVHV